MKCFLSKKRSIFMIIIAVCCLSVALAILANNCLYIDIIEMSLYKSEISKPTAYTYFDKVYVGDDVVDLNKVLDNENYMVRQVFCVDENKIYFCYSYRENEIFHCCLATVDTDGSNLKTVLNESFGFNRELYYEIIVSKDYKERNGYFYDNKIVITDFSKLVEYNIETNTRTEYIYSEYDHPKMDLSWEFSPDDQSVSFITSNGEVFINKEILSSESDVANKIIRKNNHKIWSGDSALTHFFDSVQVVDDDVYVICRVLSYHGNTYAVAFKCNLAEQVYNYTDFHFTFDVIYEKEFYLVPVKHQSR